jgi:hypothetical protein
VTNRRNAYSCTDDKTTLVLYCPWMVEYSRSHRKSVIFVVCVLLMAGLSPVLMPNLAGAQGTLRRCEPVSGPQWTQGGTTSFAWEVEANENNTCEDVAGIALSFTYSILSATEDLSAITFGPWQCLAWKSELIGACSKLAASPSEGFLVYANPANRIRGGTSVNADGSVTFPPRPAVARSTGAPTTTKSPKPPANCPFSGPEWYRPVPSLVNLRGTKWMLYISSGTCQSSVAKAKEVAKFLVDPWAETAIVLSRLEVEMFDVGSDRCIRTDRFSAVCLSGAGTGTTRILNRPGTIPIEFLRASQDNRYLVGFWPRVSTRIYVSEQFGYTSTMGSPINSAGACGAALPGSTWEYNNGGIGSASGSTWKATVSERDICPKVALLAAEITAGFGPRTPAIYGRTVEGWGCFYFRKPQLVREGMYPATEHSRFRY